MALHGRIAMVAALGLAGCELVLGDLPPVKKHGASSAESSASSTGAGGTSSSATSSAGGGTSSASVGAGGAGGCCDCDGDHHRAIVCGGDDCDDHDARVYPGEPTYYGEPSPTVGFDYDCENGPQRDPSLDVTVNCNTLALPCATGVGYLTMVPPACGQTGPWGSCKKSTNGLTCVNDVVDAARVMTCK